VPRRTAVVQPDFGVAPLTGDVGPCVMVQGIGKGWFEIRVTPVKITGQPDKGTRIDKMLFCFWQKKKQEKNTMRGPHPSIRKVPHYKTCP
jgi:hypothetical protein